MYRIQIQEWFTWIDVMTVHADDNMVAYHMNQIKDSNPDKRVRCVDQSGRLIDLL